MKTSKTTLIIIGMLLGGAVLGGTIYAAANHYLTKNAAGEDCKIVGQNISVTIQNDTFSQKQIDGHLCDTLTITNNDDKVRNIAFGEHDKHTPYDGVTEKILQKDGSFTVTLNKTGTYEVHDHLEDETQAFFTVTD